MRQRESQVPTGRLAAIDRKENEESNVVNENIYIYIYIYIYIT